MTSKRLHTVLVIALILLCAALVGGTYGTNKLLTSQTDQLLPLKAKNQALSEEQISLTKAKKDIQTYNSLNKIAQAVVPQDKNQAEAVREIVNVAAANNVILTSIKFPPSTLGLLPNGSVPGAASSGTATVSPTATAGANSKSATLSQLTQVKNIPGVYQLPITLGNDDNSPARYENFIAFLSDLEHNRRTAQVSTITLEPDPSNRDLLTFNLTVSEYIKP